MLRRHSTLWLSFAQSLEGRGRKIRCTFNSEHEDTCISCFGRRIPCLDQQHSSISSPAPAEKAQSVRDRLARLEEQMQLVLGQSSSERANATGDSEGQIVTTNQSPAQSSNHTVSGVGFTYRVNAPICPCLGANSVYSLSLILS